MKDQQKPSFHSYSLFPPGAAELFPDQSATNCAAEPLSSTQPHKQHLGTCALNLATTENSNRTHFCPRCSASVPDNLNWCSTCGELMIGASLCSPSGVEYKASNALQVSQSAPSTTEWQQFQVFNAYNCHRGNQLRFQDAINNSQRAMSAVTLNPIANATSLSIATSFSPAFFSTSATSSENFPVSLAHQTHQTYQIAEASVSHRDTQLESLQSHFGALHLSDGLPGSVNSSTYANTRECDFANTSTDQFHQSNFGMPCSHSDHTRDGIYVLQHLGRQRCISGPILGCAMTTDRGYIPQVRQSDLTPYLHRLNYQNAPPTAFYGAQVQPRSYVMHHSFEQIPVQPTSAIYEPESANRNLTQPDYRSSYRSRRRHPSESLELQHYSITTSSKGVDITEQRPRSFSSDVRVSDQQNQRTEYIPNGFRWNSSRMAWTAHSPAALKKKPAAYLYNSYQHAAWEFSNQAGYLHREFPDPTDEIVFASSTHDDRSNTSTRSNPNGLGTSESGKATQKSRRHPAPKQRHSKPSTTVPLTCDSNPAMCSADGDQSPVPSDCQAKLNGDRTASPSIPQSDDRPSWLALPNELWIAIVRYLPQNERGHLAMTCRRLSNLIWDPSFWNVIQVHRKQNLTDTTLSSIGRLRPSDLRFSYCHGNGITEKGLRQLFKALGPNLRALSFVGCSKGIFDSDLTLLLAAEHCPNLNEVDASYTQAVRDRTVTALAKSLRQLISLKLNGAQKITFWAIRKIVRYHKDTLQRLELFGCFRLNSSIFPELIACQQLRALALGHLHHLTSHGFLELVSKLPLLASLDLRGTQSLANDTNLSHMADKCPQLEEVVLANMLSVRHEAGIVQMLHRLPRLRVLDLCGLAAVGDLTMEALANGCPQLEELDVSCTSVTHKGLSHLTEAPAKCLRCLRISHCREITKEVLEKLVKACTNLTMIHAYGFKAIKDWSFLQKIRPTLHVECDG